jgi:hypothetical protein
MGTYYIAGISTGSLFSSNWFSKNVVPLGSTGNNCLKYCPSENIIAGTLFLKLFSGNQREPLLLHVFLSKAFFF